MKTKLIVVALLVLVGITFQFYKTKSHLKNQPSSVKKTANNISDDNSKTTKDISSPSSDPLENLTQLAPPTAEDLPQIDNSYSRDEKKAIEQERKAALERAKERTIIFNRNRETAISNAIKNYKGPTGKNPLEVEFPKEPKTQPQTGKPGLSENLISKPTNTPPPPPAPSHVNKIEPN